MDQKLTILDRFWDPDLSPWLPKDGQKSCFLGQNSVRRLILPFFRTRGYDCKIQTHRRRRYARTRWPGNSETKWTETSRGLPAVCRSTGRIYTVDSTGRIYNGRIQMRRNWYWDRSVLNWRPNDHLILFVDIPVAGNRLTYAKGFDPE